MSAVREKLESEVMDAEWLVLQQHHEREALFVVDPAVPLLEVAVAIAENQAVIVDAWMRGGQLARPSETQVAAWNADERRLFRSVIVQPFVLVQVG